MFDEIIEAPFAFIKRNTVTLIDSTKGYYYTDLDNYGYRDVVISKDDDNNLVIVAHKLNYHCSFFPDDRGLTKEQAEHRIQKYGPNSVEEYEGRSFPDFWNKKTKYRVPEGWYQVDSTGPHTIMMSQYTVINKMAGHNGEGL